METTPQLKVTFASYVQLPDEGEIFVYSQFAQPKVTSGSIEIVCSDKKLPIDTIKARHGNVLSIRTKFNSYIGEQVYIYYIQMTD